MRALKTCLVTLFLGLCSPALSQFGTTECAYEYDPPGASNPRYRTCLSVSNRFPQVGDPVDVTAWLFSVPAGGHGIATSFTLYDGSFAVLTQNTSVHQTLGNALDVNIAFTSLGTVQLRADPSAAGRLDSPPITITVGKFSPQYTISATPSVALIGQSVPLHTNTLLHRPNGGVLAFYVTPPGGNVNAPIEFARKTVTVTGPDRVVDTDVRNFAFVAPYNVPGEYLLQAGYLGDGFNAENRSEYKRVRVGPFPTATALTQSSETSIAGKAVTLTATVTPAAGAIAAPNGDVEFFDGTTLVGSAPLASGTAVLVTTQLRATGARSLTARYVGDVWNVASTSAVLAHTTKVDPAVLVPIIDVILNP
jgi:hypothetical protein